VRDDVQIRSNRSEPLRQIIGRVDPGYLPHVQNLCLSRIVAINDLRNISPGTLRKLIVISLVALLLNSAGVSAFAQASRPAAEKDFTAAYDAQIRKTITALAASMLDKEGKIDHSALIHTGASAR
jgi:hypothetical protein